MTTVTDYKQLHEYLEDDYNLQGKTIGKDISLEDLSEKIVFANRTLQSQRLGSIDDKFFELIYGRGVKRDLRNAETLEVQSDIQQDKIDDLDADEAAMVTKTYKGDLDEDKDIEDIEDATYVITKVTPDDELQEQMKEELEERQNEEGESGGGD